MVTIVLWCSLLLFNETRWKLITVENFVGAFSMRKCCKMVKWYFVQPRWRLPLIILLWLHQKFWSRNDWPKKWLIGFKIGRLDGPLIGLHLIPEVLVKKVFCLSAEGTKMKTKLFDHEGNYCAWVIWGSLMRHAKMTVFLILRFLRLPRPGGKPGTFWWLSAGRIFCPDDDQAAVELGGAVAELSVVIEC